MTGRTWMIVVAIALLGVPTASAGVIQMSGSTAPRVQTTVSADPWSGDLAFPFRLQEDRSAYLKVVPTPWNPAFANGTAGTSGWWTEVSIVTPSGTQVKGATTGTSPVELGDLAADTSYTLRLRVHAPAGALATAGEYRLSYTLAVRGPGEGTGNGGELHTSASILPTLRVAAPALGGGTPEPDPLASITPPQATPPPGGTAPAFKDAATAGATGPNPPGKAARWATDTWLAILFLLLAALVAILLIARRRHDTVLVADRDAPPIAASPLRDLPPASTGPGASLHAGASDAPAPPAAAHAPPLHAAGGGWGATAAATPPPQAQNPWAGAGTAPAGAMHAHPYAWPAPPMHAAAPAPWPPQPMYAHVHPGAYGPPWAQAAPAPMPWPYGSGWAPPAQPGYGAPAAYQHAPPSFVGIPVPMQAHQAPPAQPQGYTVFVPAPPTVAQPTQPQSYTIFVAAPQPPAPPAQPAIVSYAPQPALPAAPPAPPADAGSAARVSGSHVRGLREDLAQTREDARVLREELSRLEDQLGRMGWEPRRRQQSGERSA